MQSKNPKSHVNEKAQEEIIRNKTNYYNKCKEISEVFGTLKGEVFLNKLIAGLIRQKGYDEDVVASIGHDAAIANLLQYQGQKSLLLQFLSAIELIKEYPNLQSYLKK